MIDMRSAAAVVALAIGVASVVLSRGVIDHFAAYLQAQLPPIDRELVVVKAPFSRFNGSDLQGLEDMRERLRGAFSELRGVSVFRAEYKEVVSADREYLKKVVGVDQELFGLLGITAVSGRLLHAADAGAADRCVVPPDVARQARLVASGRGIVLPIDGLLHRVVGIIGFESAVPAGGFDNDAILVPYHDPLLAGGGMQEKGVVLAFARGRTPDRTTLGNKLKRLLGADRVEVWSYADQQRRSARMLAMIGLATGGVAALFLVVVGLSIATFVSYLVADRQREIGIKRAIGAQRVHIFLEIQAEVLALAVVGVLAGWLSAWQLADRLVAPVMQGLGAAQSPFALMWSAYGNAALAVLAVASIAAMPPAIRAAGLSPSLAVRDE
jgi:putative ABC transport system permease protein